PGRRSPPPRRAPHHRVRRRRVMSRRPTERLQFFPPPPRSNGERRPWNKLASGSVAPAADPTRETPAAAKRGSAARRRAHGTNLQRRFAPQPRSPLPLVAIRERVIQRGIGRGTVLRGGL